MNLTNVQLGSNTAPGAPFTMNRYVDAKTFKLVINGTGTNIFELTTGAAGATRRFAFASTGQYTMDAYGVGAFTGTAAKWLAVTAGGLVIEENPPTASITANNGLTMSTPTNAQWGGTLVQNTTITHAGFTVAYNGTVAATAMVSINNTATGANAALGVTAAGITGALSANNTGTGNGIDATAVSGSGINANSTSGSALRGRVNPSSTNTDVRIAQFIRGTTGTAAANMGGYVDYLLEDDGANDQTAIRLIARWSSAVNGNESADYIIQNIGAGAIATKLEIKSDARVVLYGRLNQLQGADVASVAGAIALGFNGNTFELTGTNAVTLISNVGWQNGSEITFVFTSTASLTDGTANSGTDIGMELAGNANFTGSADDLITLVLCEMGGTQRWREKCRSVN